jgi:hypothetical protein
MSKKETSIASSEKYPSLIGQKFDLSDGVYILIKNGKVVCQGNSSVKVVASIPDHVTKPDDEFQLANLLFVRNDMYFLQHVHSVSNGCALMTPALPVVIL